MSDSQTPFQAELGDELRNCHAVALGVPVSGDRVQMDTMKIARRVYQYAALDDCSRLKKERIRHCEWRLDKSLGEHYRGAKETAYEKMKQCL